MSNVNVKSAVKSMRSKIIKLVILNTSEVPFKNSKINNIVRNILNVQYHSLNQNAMI